MNRKKIAEELIRFLKRKYGKRIKEMIRREEPFKLLITTILSQRTRDENTRRASKNLFSRVKTPEEILELSEKELEELIKPSGMYRQKARKIKEVCRILLKEYDGKVPKTREELMKLPGVGLKTSNIVLSYGYGKPVIAVDVHVEVISKRLGLVPLKASVEEVENELEVLIPPEDRWIVNLGLVKFGKEVCITRKPRCNICPLNKMCCFYEGRITKTF